MGYVIAFALLLVIVFVWWVVFRAALRDPNNGNDLSQGQDQSNQAG